MTIDQLYKAINDIEFQYKRFVKTNEFDGESLVRFDIISAEICEQLISMKLSEIISEEARTIGRIDMNYLPQIGFGRKLLNMLSFGYATKRYLHKMRLVYLYEAINSRHRLFKMVELHLKEE